LIESGVRIESEDFGAEVILRFVLPSDDIAPLKSKVTELSAGTVVISDVETQMAVW